MLWFQTKPPSLVFFPFCSCWWFLAPDFSPESHRLFPLLENNATSPVENLGVSPSWFTGREERLYSNSSDVRDKFFQWVYLPVSVCKEGNLWHTRHTHLQRLERKAISHSPTDLHLHHDYWEWTSVSSTGDVPDHPKTSGKQEGNSMRALCICLITHLLTVHNFFFRLSNYRKLRRWWSHPVQRLVFHFLLLFVYNWQLPFSTEKTRTGTRAKGVGCKTIGYWHEAKGINIKG